MTRHPVPRGHPRTLLVVGAALAVAGCDRSLEGPTELHDARLDEELSELLEAGRGREYYVLPSSDQLDRIPQDPKNPLTPAKVELGRLLFHETALGVNNERPEGKEGYSCAACHVASAGFQANVPQGIAEGGTGFGADGEARVLWKEVYDPADLDVLPIRAPSVLNVAFQEIVLWNGGFAGVGDNVGTEASWEEDTAFESNWFGMHGVETQAHAGLEVHRMEDVHESRVAEIEAYQELYARAFGSGSGENGPIDRMNTALAIAAYERTLLTDRAPWQRWLKGEEDAMTPLEKRGAILFFGKAGCVDCHDGPALNSMDFYALGMADLDAALVRSRVHLEPEGGAVPEKIVRGRGGFTGKPEDDYKFKVPQLYNLAASRFYGHGATFSTLRQVVEYKNAGAPQKSVPTLSPLFRPLGLTPAEVDALVAFLEGALYDPDVTRYLPDALPSGNCMGVNDPRSQLDKGCGGG